MWFSSARLLILLIKSSNSLFIMDFFCIISLLFLYCIKNCLIARLLVGLMDLFGCPLNFALQKNIELTYLTSSLKSRSREREATKIQSWIHM